MFLIALVCVATIAAVAASGPPHEARDLAATIARKLRCAPRLPDNCWHDPLTVAYGRAKAGAVRALAPGPSPRAGLLPVDFRTCRSASCALPGSNDGLTASNRRVTAFTATSDGASVVTIDYWLYRPGQAWELIRRRAGADVVAQLASTPLLDDQVPRLVPLETLDGRNHVGFTVVEEPPWRWQIGSVYRG